MGGAQRIPKLSAFVHFLSDPPAKLDESNESEAEPTYVPTAKLLAGERAAKAEPASVPTAKTLTSERAAKPHTDEPAVKPPKKTLLNLPDTSRPSRPSRPSSARISDPAFTESSGECRAEAHSAGHPYGTHVPFPPGTRIRTTAAPPVQAAVAIDGSREAVATDSRVATRQAERKKYRDDASNPSIPKGEQNSTLLFTFPHPASIAAWDHHPKDLREALADARRGAERAAAEAAAAIVVIEDDDDPDILDIVTLPRASLAGKRSRKSELPAASTSTSTSLEVLAAAGPGESDKPAPGPIIANASSSMPLVSLPAERPQSISRASPTIALRSWTVRTDDLACTEEGVYLNDSCINWVSPC